MTTETNLFRNDAGQEVILDGNVPILKPGTALTVRFDDFDYLAESARTASGHFHGHLVALSEIDEAFKAFIAAGQQLDRIKKLLFYGEDFKRGRFASTLALEGDGEDAHEARDSLLDFDHEAYPKSDQILHGTLGMATEAGEIIEALQKTIFDGQPLDLVNLSEEIGDSQWYEAMLCRVIGTTFDQVQRTNIAKLRKRFPDKFSTEAANERDLDAERQVLEGGYAHDDPLVDGDEGRGGDPNEDDPLTSCAHIIDPELRAKCEASLRKGG